jgi:peptidoglycan/LPS O-acetylase OafA/YrhL
MRENKSVRPMPPGSGEIRPMTGVRGVAALSVVALHFFDHPDAAIRPWRHTYLAVDLFFILSGLVLALTYSSTVTLLIDQ